MSKLNEYLDGRVDAWDAFLNEGKGEVIVNVDAPIELVIDPDFMNDVHEAAKVDYPDMKFCSILKASL